MEFLIVMFFESMRCAARSKNSAAPNLFHLDYHRASLLEQGFPLLTVSALFTLSAPLTIASYLFTGCLCLPWAESVAIFQVFSIRHFL